MSRLKARAEEWPGSSGRQALAPCPARERGLRGGLDCDGASLGQSLLVSVALCFVGGWQGRDSGRGNARLCRR